MSDASDASDASETYHKGWRCLSVGSPLFWLPTFLHLLFLENPGAFLIPMTTRSMLHEMTVHITMIDNNLAVHNLTCDIMDCEAGNPNNNTISMVYNEVKEGVTEYMRYPIWELATGKKFHSSNGLIEGNFGNLLPILLIIIHTWQIVFVAGLILGMCAAHPTFTNGGYFDYRSGAYFAFVYRLQNNRYYYHMIRGLMWISGIFFATFAIFLVSQESWDFFERTMGTCFIQFIAWFYGVTQLRTNYIFTFNWDNSKFAKLRFKREFKLFITKNSQYSEKLLAALVHAHRNNATDKSKDPYLSRFLDIDEREEFHESYSSLLEQMGTEDEFEVDPQEELLTGFRPNKDKATSGDASSNAEDASLTE